MDGNDIIIRVQFLLSTSGEEATNYLMSRGCVRLPITEPEKKNWRNKRRPTTHKFNARWCSRLESKHNLSGAHHYPVLSLSARTILPSGISFAASAGETFFREFSRVLLFDHVLPSRQPTYVVLIVSQHGTEGHEVLGWRCCARTEGRGIIRPQEGRQR